MSISELGHTSQPLVAKSRPATLTIKERFSLTQPGSTKSTFHVSLDMKKSGLSFQVGDSLGIFGQNDPVLVERLLAAMGALGDEGIADSRTGEEISLREFLTKRANLSRLTSSFLKGVPALESLLRPENKALLIPYLEAHDPLDFFKEHAVRSIPLQDLSSLFAPLLPRFYSVASSQKTFPDEVHLTVALSTFTHAGEKRFGVASHFLCNLAEIDKTPISLYVQPAHSFRLPPSGNTPIIMIGPGTGVAPFRAFVQERMHVGATGKNWLFFGERNQQCDYFYREEWEGLVQAKKLQLDLAFSRDTSEKMYVQHRMHAQARELWAWLQEGACLYVCGDAERMARSVEAMLIQIVQEQGKLSVEAAQAYVKALRKEKRYLKDVY